MNDIVPYKPLSYEEQLSRADDMMRQLVSYPVVKLKSFRELRDVQSQLKDRIRKQKEQEKHT